MFNHTSEIFATEIVIDKLKTKTMKVKERKQETYAQSSNLYKGNGKKIKKKPYQTDISHSYDIF